MFSKSREHPKSAGESGWHRSDKRGPDFSEGPSLEKNVFTGKLLLYDIATEKMFSIDTKQGDSEVLLVSNGTVYYRSSDRLYRAPMTTSGIGKPELIATDEIIRDAHWAFIKR